MNETQKIDSPDRVSEIVAETAIKEAAKGGKLCLRTMQSELYKIQRRDRLQNMAAVVRRLQTLRHQRRVRQLPIGECRVIDTGRDGAKKRLYFELSNNQVVRADRIVARSKNPAMRKLVADAIEANANREAKAA